MILSTSLLKIHDDVESTLQDEIRVFKRSHQNEVAFKGNVYNNFEDKLRNCRRELEEEHETSLRNELKYQEKDLIHKFNEKILEKDSTLLDTTRH